MELEPGRDPVWGTTQGRSWCKYGAVYSPLLRGVFFWGEGPHGGVMGETPSTTAGKNHERYGYTLDDVFFYDINANKWICIFPGTPTSHIEDFAQIDQFNEGRWFVDWDKNVIRIADAEGSLLPVWLEGGILPHQPAVHPYTFLGWDPNRNVLWHIGRSLTRFRGWNPLFPTAGVSAVRDWLEGQDFFSNISSVPLGPLYFDPTTGKFERDHAPQEPGGVGSFRQAWVLIPHLDKLFRFGDGVSTRFYDLASGTFEEVLAGSPPTTVTDQVSEHGSAYDSKRHRVYTGPPAGSSSNFPVDPNENFCFFDFDSNEWVLPKPTGDIPPGDTSWSTNRARMIYDKDSDKILLFYLPNSSADAVYAYDADSNTWDKSADVPAWTRDFPGSQFGVSSCVDYVDHLNAYVVFRGRDGHPHNTKMAIYKHTEGAPGDDELLYTLDAVNTDSESVSPDGHPYTFGLVFEPGKITSGRHPLLTVNGNSVDYQIDREVRRHGDGSLSRAVGSLILPEIPAGGTATIEVTSVPVQKPDGSVGVTQLESDDYSAEIVQDEVSYTASLNDAIDVENYRITRDGPVCTRLVAWRNLSNGGQDHSEFWVRFYATEFSDGTTQVMVQFINGRVADGVQHTVTALKVYRGITEIFSYDNDDSPFTFNHHSSLYAATEEGEPIWSQKTPTVKHRFSEDYKRYYVTARAWWGYRELTVDPTLPDDGQNGRLFFEVLPKIHLNWRGMAPLSDSGVHDPTGGYRASLTAGGEWPMYGPVPNWTAKAIATHQDFEWERIDRILAFLFYDNPLTIVNSDVNTMPVLIDQEFDGLPTGQHHHVWRATSSSESFTSFDYPNWSRWFGDLWGSHIPQPSYWRAIADGDEWFDDQCLLLANQATGPCRTDFTGSLPNRGVRRCSKEDGSGLWDGLVFSGQNRSFGNAMRNIECAHRVCPEDDPHREYLTALRDNNWGAYEDTVNGPYAEGGSHGSYRFLGYQLNASPNTLRSHSAEIGPCCYGGTLAYWLDGASEAFVYHFVNKQVIGKGYDGCLAAASRTVHLAPEGGGVSEQVWNDTAYRESSENLYAFDIEGCQDGIQNVLGEHFTDPDDSNPVHWSNPGPSMNNFRLLKGVMAQAAQAAAGQDDSTLFDRAKAVLDYMVFWDDAFSDPSFNDYTGHTESNAAREPKFHLRYYEIEGL